MLTSLKNIVSTVSVLALVSLVSCGSHQKPLTEATASSAQSVAIGGVRQMPRAVIYKTNGNWNDRVTVKLNQDRSALEYFPGPYDVSADTEPMVLADGWLLDRQGGISETTGFLKWTMTAYHEFKNVPSVSQIMDAVIPDARVTEVIVLPMTSMAAQSDTAAVNGLIRSGEIYRQD